MRVPGGWGSQISRQAAHEGGKVSPTHRPLLAPGNIPGENLCWSLSRPQRHNAAGMIVEDTTGNRTRDLPACSAGSYTFFFKSPHASLYSRTVSRDGRHGSDCRCSNSPWARVHTFQVKASASDLLMPKDHIIYWGGGELILEQHVEK